VLVLIRYTVPAGRRDEFVSRMRAVGRSRRRTGGETGVSAPTAKERMTEYDRQLLDRARELADGEPVVEHLLQLTRR
jgi:hypothetical protein